MGKTLHHISAFDGGHYRAFLLRLKTDSWVEPHFVLEKLQGTATEQKLFALQWPCRLLPVTAEARFGRRRKLYPRSLNLGSLDDMLYLETKKGIHKDECSLTAHGQSEISAMHGCDHLCCSQLLNDLWQG